MKDDITPLLLAIQRLRNATNTIKINSPYRSPLMQLKYKEAAKAYQANSQHLQQTEPKKRFYKWFCTYRIIKEPTKCLKQFI